MILTVRHVCHLNLTNVIDHVPFACEFRNTECAIRPLLSSTGCAIQACAIVVSNIVYKVPLICSLQQVVNHSHYLLSLLPRLP